jgi:hypothetical protein
VDADLSFNRRSFSIRSRLISATSFKSFSESCSTEAYSQSCTQRSRKHQTCLRLRQYSASTTLATRIEPEKRATRHVSQRNQLRTVASDVNSPALEAEMAELLDQQLDTLQQAIFISMTEQQKREYDARAHRINEIQQILRTGAA